MKIGGADPFVEARELVHTNQKYQIEQNAHDRRRRKRLVKEHGGSPFPLADLRTHSNSPFPRRAPIAAVRFLGRSVTRGFFVGLTL